LKSPSIAVLNGLLSKCLRPLGASVIMKNASGSVKKWFTTYPPGRALVFLIALISLSAVPERSVDSSILSATNRSCDGITNFEPFRATIKFLSSTKLLISISAFSREVSFKSAFTVGSFANVPPYASG
jgi:hypothetical protein